MQNDRYHPRPVTLPDMAVVALDTDQAKAIAVVAIIALVVLGALISAIISAIVVRIVVLVVVLVLAGAVWSQRSAIGSAAKRCDASFFGVHLTPGDATVRKRCRDAANKLP